MSTCPHLLHHTFNVIARECRQGPLSSPRALSLLAAMAPPLPVAWTPLAPSIFSWVSRTWPAEGKQGWAPQAAEGGAGGEDCPSASRLSDRYGFLGDSDEGTVAVGHIVETEGGAPRDVVGAAHLGPAAHTMEGDGSTRERGEAPVAGFKRKRKLLLAARTLKVEEPAVSDLAYTDRRDGAHTTLKTLRSRDKDCTGNLEETLIGLPISAVLNLHRQVVQCQARVRGNITRKRLARGKQLDQIGSGVAMHIARNTS